MKKSFKIAAVLAGISLVTLSTARAAIVSISESGGDTGRFAIIEPTGSPNGSLFGEDAWMFTDRTHEYNGARFTSAGVLSTVEAAGDVVIGLPSYLVGQPYIANANNHRDNANYLLTLTVDVPSYLYLLVDNRLGDNVNTTPPTLGSGGAGLMAWVADMGFVQMNTGLSPNGQTDFGAADEGGSLSASIPADRAHAGASQPNLAVGPGNGLNQFFTVYMKQVDAGSITLREQNGGGLNMYGVVVAPVPEPSTFGLMGLGLLLGVGAPWRRQRK
jgi:hypothetical protein